MEGRHAVHDGTEGMGMKGHNMKGHEQRSA